MFYILKNEEGDFDYIESNAINHGSNKGFPSLPEAAESVGLPADYFDEPNLDAMFYSKVKTRLVQGAEALRIDAKGISYPRVSAAALKASEAAEFKGSVSIAVASAMKKLGIAY